jgi:hypothetical protein
LELAIWNAETIHSLNWLKPSPFQPELLTRSTTAQSCVRREVLGVHLKSRYFQDVVLGLSMELNADCLAAL